MLLTSRKLLQSKAIAIENDLRGALRNFGLKVGMIGKRATEGIGAGYPCVSAAAIGQSVRLSAMPRRANLTILWQMLAATGQVVQKRFSVRAAARS